MAESCDTCRFCELRERYGRDEPYCACFLRWIGTTGTCNCWIEKKEGKTMSERQEHKKRYNRRLEYIAHFTKWLEQEPSMIRIISWWRWKKRRPIWKEEE